jgi:predicted transcriptional regulator
VIYDRFRTAKSAVEIVGRENVDQFSNKDLSTIKKKQDQVNNLRKQISKQSSELIQMKESLSYFKPSKGGSSILDDAKKRIENSEKEIAAKEEQLNNLEVEIDKMKRTD